MAMRGSWLLRVVLVITASILAIVTLRHTGTGPSFDQAAGRSSILGVPAQYASIQAAINAAQPGDVIRVMPGVYNENIVLNKAVVLTAASFDRVEAANDTTVIDGGNGAATITVTGGLTLAPSVHGFVVRGGKYGIQAHSPFSVQGCYFYGSETAVDYQAGSGGINRNNLYFSEADDGLRIEDLTAPLLVESNRFLYEGGDAVEVDFPATSVGAGVEADIWNNVLAGSGQDGIKFVDFATNPRDGDRRVMIAGNLLVNNRRAGIGFVQGGSGNEDYSGAEAAETIRAYNNTFYGNDYALSGGGNLVAFNNIISNTTVRGAWRVQGQHGSNSVIAYTLFWNNRVDEDQTVLGLGDIFGQDPLFVGAPSPGPDGQWGTIDDDFSGLNLQPQSPAIDKGSPQYAVPDGELVPPGPLTGFTGVAPDLGWREVGEEGFATPLAAATAPMPMAAATDVTPLSTEAAGPTSAQPIANTTEDTVSAPAAAAVPSVSATGTPPGTSAPLLTIRGVSPDSVKTNANVMLTITGSGFEEGATVDFEGEHEAPPQVQSVTVAGPATIQVAVYAADDAHDTDVWDIRVTNPDGTTARLVGAFTITP